jgi:hypothetical protein
MEERTRKTIYIIKYIMPLKGHNIIVQNKGAILMYSRDELIHSGIYYANKMEAMDELYHYGKKGMKWGENIFGEAYEAMKRNTNKAYALKNVSEQKQKEEQMRRAGAGGGETGAQRAARLKKELLLRRANKAAEKEGKAPYQDPYSKPVTNTVNSDYYKKKYGGIGKGSDYVNKQQTANQYAEKYGGIGKGSDYVNKQVSDANREQASKKTGVGGLNIAGLKDRDAADKKLTGSNGNRNLNSSSSKVQQGGANKFSNQNKEEPSENKKYIDNINTNGKDVAKDILKNDPMFNEYLNSTSDLKIKAARESGDSLVEDIVKGNTASNSRQNTANERLGQSIINKTKKKMHDDIDSHSKGMSASQIALAKANSDTAVDEAFKELNKDREKEITGSATDRMLGRSALGKAEQEGMNKFSRSVALSTGGLNDVSGGTAGRGPNPYEKTESAATNVAEAPKTEAPKAEPAKPKMTAKEMIAKHTRENAIEHGYRDVTSPVTGENLINAEDVYQLSQHGETQEAEKMITDAIREVQGWKSNPRLYGKYQPKIDQAYDDLIKMYGKNMLNAQRTKMYTLAE